ncbi:MAG: PspC domain-containing protein [Nonlabens sp.]
MNKTININLAGLFFHIDENAYNRLQRYLSSVRKSFAGTQGAEEIMSDIESRIAELFLEKRANDQQVISIIHVEEVIEVMGQPEDYEVDEEIFEEAPRNKFQRPNFGSKQLFRDTSNGYVGGVCAGLAHYVNLEVIWVRLIWVFLFISSVGWLIPVYIVLWILVPDAVTNNQRLKMMGKELNINNIGENAKADFDPVVDGQTDGDHHIVGQKGKRGSVKFFGLIGSFFRNIFKALFKIFGLIVFLASSIGLIGLIVTLITVCFIDVDGQNLIHFFDVVIPANNASWLLVTAMIFAAGIPLLVLSILGLRMLVSNMKSIGTPAKIVLIVLWIISIIVLSILVARVAASQAFEANIQNVEKFSTSSDDVFELNLETLEDLDNTIYVNNRSFNLMEYNGEIALRNYDLRVALASTTDSVARALILQSAKGSSYPKAKKNASEVVFDYSITENAFVAPDYTIIPKGNGLVQQETKVIIYLPVGTKVKLNERFYQRYSSYLNNDSFRLGHGWEHIYEVGSGKSICLDCPDLNEAKQKVSDQSVKNDVTDTISTLPNTMEEKTNNWKYQD